MLQMSHRQGCLRHYISFTDGQNRWILCLLNSLNSFWKLLCKRCKSHTVEKLSVLIIHLQKSETVFIEINEAVIPHF